jgi:hypothetical protein
MRAHAGYGVDSYHLEDAGMGRSVSGMVRDAQGFLWIASRSGITRYDGRSYRTYRLSQSDILENHDGHEVMVRGCADGRICAFTDNGCIYFYDPRPDAFVLLDYLGGLEDYRLLQDVYVAPDSTLWIASTRGLVILDPHLADRVADMLMPDTYIRFLLPLGEGIIAWDLVRDRAVEVSFAADIHAMEAWDDTLLWVGSGRELLGIKVARGGRGKKNKNA